MQSRRQSLRIGHSKVRGVRLADPTHLPIFHLTWINFRVFHRCFVRNWSKSKRLWYLQVSLIQQQNLRLLVTHHCQYRRYSDCCHDFPWLRFIFCDNTFIENRFISGVGNGLFLCLFIAPLCSSMVSFTPLAEFRKTTKSICRKKVFVPISPASVCLSVALAFSSSLADGPVIEDCGCRWWRVDTRQPDELSTKLSSDVHNLSLICCQSGNNVITQRYPDRVRRVTLPTKSFFSNGILWTLKAAS